MRKVVFSILVILLPIIDSSLMPLLSVCGFYGNISFVFLICYTIYYGKKNGLIVAIVLGLIQDLLYVKVIGINPLCNILVVYCIIKISDLLNKEKTLLISVLTLFFSLLRGGLIFIMFFLIKYKFNPYFILFTSLINFVICLVSYKSFYKFFNSEQMKKDWNFKER